MHMLDEQVDQYSSDGEATLRTKIKLHYGPAIPLRAHIHRKRNQCTEQVTTHLGLCTDSHNSYDR